MRRGKISGGGPGGSLPDAQHGKFDEPSPHSAPTKDSDRVPSHRRIRGGTGGEAGRLGRNHRRFPTPRWAVDLFDQSLSRLDLAVPQPVDGPPSGRIAGGDH